MPNYPPPPRLLNGSNASLALSLLFLYFVNTFVRVVDGAAVKFATEASSSRYLFSTAAPVIYVLHLTSALTLG